MMTTSSNENQQVMRHNHHLSAPRSILSFSLGFHMKQELERQTKDPQPHSHELDCRYQIPALDNPCSRQHKTPGSQLLVSKYSPHQGSWEKGLILGLELGSPREARTSRCARKHKNVCF